MKIIRINQQKNQSSLNNIPNQKGFSSIIALVGLVIIVLIGAIIYFRKFNVSKTGPISDINIPKQNESANWKTFTSNYGYTVDYPADWETHIAAPGAPVEDQAGISSRRYFTPLKNGQGRNIFIDVFLGSTTTLQLQQEVISHYDWVNKKTTTINLAGVQAQDTTGLENGAEAEVIIFQKGNLIFVIQTTPTSMDTFKNMLTTFKFTN